MKTKMTNEEYHAMTEIVGTSTLKVFLDDPAMYYHYYVAKQADPPCIGDKPSVIVGDLIHQLLLERRNISDIVATYPHDCYKKNGTLNPKPAAEFRKAMQEEGKLVIKDTDVMQIESIYLAASHSDLTQVLNDSRIVCEEPIFWKDTMSGVQCKAKPDALLVTPEKVQCFDLKVTGSIKPDEWSRVASRFRYWLQCCHYTSGLMHLYPNHDVSFTFYVVENKFPYRIVSYVYDEDSFNRAWDKYSATLQDLGRRIAENDWVSDWEKQCNELTIKPWELGEVEETELEGFDDE